MPSVFFSVLHTVRHLPRLVGIFALEHRGPIPCSMCTAQRSEHGSGI